MRRWDNSLHVVENQRAPTRLTVPVPGAASGLELVLDVRLRDLHGLVVYAPLSGSVLNKQHHAEPCFALHHASVSICSLFETNGLNHRADILQDAEGKGVLGIDRRSGQ